MADNVIVGDNFGTDLPRTDVPQEILIEEKKLAKYSRTQEYKRLKDFIEAKIKFYQHYLPSGELVETDPKGQLLPSQPRPDLTAHWIAACIVIKEFQGILDSYEQAKQAVADESGRTQVL